MRGIEPINRGERLAYIDLFCQERDFAIQTIFKRCGSFMADCQELSPIHFIMLVLAVRQFYSF